MRSAPHEALLLPCLKAVALHVARARSGRDVYQAIAGAFRPRGVSVKAFVPDTGARMLRDLEPNVDVDSQATPALSQLYGRLVDERQLVFVEDMRALVPDGTWGRGSGVMLPITVEQRVETVLTFVSRSLRRSDISLLQAVAAQTRLALARIHAESLLEDALRDATVTNERLLELQRLEPVGAAAVGILHDVNNLLSAVVGWSHELAEVAEVEHVWRACESLRSVSQAVLSLGHPSTLVPGPINFSSAVADLRPLLLALLGARVELSFDLASMIAPVTMAMSHFCQILLNLVHNARDAMPDGGRLRIRTERKVLPGGRELAVLAVSDSGPGIDSADRERIFQPFFTTKGPTAGTGLGLYVVSVLARRYGAELAVCEGERGGARFELRFAVSARLN